jgi:hypothetical protein
LIFDIRCSMFDVGYSMFDAPGQYTLSLSDRGVGLPRLSQRRSRVG